jgi:Skp family chaperone for outer membrane proteins
LKTELDKPTKIEGAFMRFIAFLCCFLMASLAVAKDLKIATVDVSKIVKEYPGYKTAQTKLAAVKDKKQSELVAEKKELDDLGVEIDRSKSVWTKSELKEKEYLYNKKRDDLISAQTQAEKDLASQENDMLQKIVDAVKAIVKKTALDQGVDVVLDSQGTIYMKDSLDLTDAVIKKYQGIDATSLDTDKDSGTTGKMNP